MLVTAWPTLDVEGGVLIGFPQEHSIAQCSHNIYIYIYILCVLSWCLCELTVEVNAISGGMPGDHARRAYFGLWMQRWASPCMVYNVYCTILYYTVQHVIYYTSPCMVLIPTVLYSHRYLPCMPPFLDMAALRYVDVSVDCGPVSYLLLPLIPLILLTSWWQPIWHTLYIILCWLLVSSGACLLCCMLGPCGRYILCTINYTVTYILCSIGAYGRSACHGLSAESCVMCLPVMCLRLSQHVTSLALLYYLLAPASLLYCRPQMPPDKPCLPSWRAWHPPHTPLGGTWFAPPHLQIGMSVSGASQTASCLASSRCPAPSAPSR